MLIVSGTVEVDPGSVGTVTMQVVWEGQYVRAGCAPKRASTRPFRLKKFVPCTTTTVPAPAAEGETEESCGKLPGAGVVVVVLTVDDVVVVLGVDDVVVETVLEGLGRVDCGGVGSVLGGDVVAERACAGGRERLEDGDGPGTPASRRATNTTTRSATMATASVNPPGTAKGIERRLRGGGRRSPPRGGAPAPAWGGVRPLYDAAGDPAKRPAPGAASGKDRMTAGGRRGRDADPVIAEEAADVPDASRAFRTASPKASSVRWSGGEPSALCSARFPVLRRRRPLPLIRFARLSVWPGGSPARGERGRSYGRSPLCSAQGRAAARPCSRDPG